MDRIAHFDVSVNHIAGEEEKLTDYNSRHTTGEVETEINYDEEYVIISLVPLLQFSTRINGITDEIIDQRHPSIKSTYAKERCTDIASSHPADKTETPNKQSLTAHKPNIKITPSNNHRCNQSNKIDTYHSSKNQTQMDRTLQYHWGSYTGDHGDHTETKQFVRNSKTGGKKNKRL